MNRRRLSQTIISELSRSTSLRKRINAHCVSCVYDDLAAGTWKQQVEACTVTSCPLWDVRPRSNSKSPFTAKGISTHTLGQGERDSSPITSKCLHTDEDCES
jgi:hypothetical protein